MRIASHTHMHVCPYFLHTNQSQTAPAGDSKAAAAAADGVAVFTTRRKSSASSPSCEAWWRTRVRLKPQSAPLQERALWRDALSDPRDAESTASFEVKGSEAEEVVLLCHARQPRRLLLPPALCSQKQFKSAALVALAATAGKGHSYWPRRTNALSSSPSSAASWLRTPCNCALPTSASLRARGAL